MLICDKCNAGITEGAKFCAQCGDPVTDADRVAAPAGDSAVANVQISFGRSSSPNYSKAVSICENVPSYSVSGEGKEIRHEVSLPITEVDLLVNLYELVGSWKSSQMLINGHAATKKELTYYGVGCYRSRQKSFKPEQYCFGEKEYEANIWGCKRLNMPIYEWGGGWLDYGEFDQKGIWHFDKDRIRHELEIKLNENELCPVLDRRRVLETLEKLPDVINPKADKNWEYRTSYEEVRGEYKEVAVGIRPVVNKIDRYVVGSYKPYWEPSEASQTSHTVSLETSNPKPRKANLSKSAKSKSSGTSNWIWGVIVVMAILYFLTR